MGRYAGTLRFPQEVEVEAFARGMCRVRGRAQQGGVVAWVSSEDLDGLPEGLVANLEKAAERKKIVDELIANNEVAIGMTEGEVLASIGKPQKRTKRADKETVSQVWEYIKYDLVPQTVYGPGWRQTVVTIPGGTNHHGRRVVTGGVGLTASTVYVKVPVGKLAVSFAEGIVESIDQSEGTLAGGKISVVVPPIEVY